LHHKKLKDRQQQEKDIVVTVSHGILLLLLPIFQLLMVQAYM